MSELHRITISPEQCAGRPCIRGLRVRVKDILDLLPISSTSLSPATSTNATHTKR